MKDELVSIITPAYKATTVLPETIASVLAQTYPNWELLIADDCSPDDTGAVIAEWAATDPRIRLITSSQRGPGGRTQRRAVRSAGPLDRVSGQRRFVAS